MHHGTDRPDPHMRFVETLAEWIEDHGDLIDGLVALRHLGDEAEVAVDEVMQVRELRKIRLGWEFWAAIVEGDGYEPEVLLLLDLLPLPTIEQCRRALWGYDLIAQPPQLRVISS